MNAVETEVTSLLVKFNQSYLAEAEDFSVLIDPFPFKIILSDPPTCGVCGKRR